MIFINSNYYFDGDDRGTNIEKVEFWGGGMLVSRLRYIGNTLEGRVESVDGKLDHILDKQIGHEQRLRKLEKSSLAA